MNRNRNYNDFTQKIGMKIVFVKLCTKVNISKIFIGENLFIHLIFKSHANSEFRISENNTWLTSQMNQKIVDLFLYSRVPNNSAARLLIFLNFSLPTRLIWTYTLIKFQEKILPAQLLCTYTAIDFFLFWLTRNICYLLTYTYFTCVIQYIVLLFYHIIFNSTSRFNKFSTFFGCYKTEQDVRQGIFQTSFKVVLHKRHCCWPATYFLPFLSLLMNIIS